MIHITTIPNRLEYGVGKAEHQNVLDGLFGQIMVDPENLMFTEVFMDAAVQFDGGIQVPTERLFHHQP